MSRWEQNVIGADAAGFGYPDAERWAAFVRAVCESPEDDTPRLIAADWLDEQGFGARAELIRLQCELSSRTNCETCYETCLAPDFLGCPEREKRRREWVLLWAVIPCWPTGIRGCGKMDFAYRRGFIEHVACSAADWFAHASALLSEHPIRQVTLTTWPDAGQLARVPRPQVFDWVIEEHTSRGAWAAYCLSATWPGIKFKVPEDNE